MKARRLETNKQAVMEGPLLIEPEIYTDTRGFFMESWNQAKFNAMIGESVEFVQDNHSYSKKGVLRGLHYQIEPYSQSKLVRCITGEIYDVAVDLRKGSKTYGKWVGVVLNSKKHDQFWIPKGFAHGFLTLSNFAEVLYKTTNFWSKEHELNLRWDDKDIAIKWPIEKLEIKLSDKDKRANSIYELNSKKLLK